MNAEALTSLAVADPAWLLGLLVLPAAAWLRARRGHPVWVVPFASSWAPRSAARAGRLPAVLVYLALACVVLALARPQELETRESVAREGYDVVLALNLSGSMQAEDFSEAGAEPRSRLDAVRPIVDAFLARRDGDRIAVVVFGGRATTLSPLTFDRAWLSAQLDRLDVGLVEDGTAIGDALALAVSRLEQPGRLEDEERLGGFVVLLTDGANNRGSVRPAEAAKLAAARGIAVYTIGAGTVGRVPMPVFDARGRRTGTRRVHSDLDERLLSEIARTTRGRYFRAEDPDTVEAAFEAIDGERKIAFEPVARVRARELFPWLAWPGVGLCLASVWLVAGGRGGAP